MGSMDDLMRLYRKDDHTQIRFLGGPRNGQTLTWSTGEPPTVIRVAVEEEPAAAVLSLTDGPTIAHYYWALDELGCPRRDDDGSCIFTYHGLEQRP